MASYSGIELHIIPTLNNRGLVTSRGETAQTQLTPLRPFTCIIERLSTNFRNITWFLKFYFRNVCEQSTSKNLPFRKFPANGNTTFKSRSKCNSVNWTKATSCFKFMIILWLKCRICVYCTYYNNHRLYHITVMDLSDRYITPSMLISKPLKVKFHYTLFTF